MPAVTHRALALVLLFLAVGADAGHASDTTPPQVTPLLPWTAPMDRKDLRSCNPSLELCEPSPPPSPAVARKYRQSCIGEWDPQHGGSSCPVDVQLKSCTVFWDLRIGLYSLIFTKRAKILELSAGKGRFLVYDLIGIKFGTLPKIQIKARRDGDMLTNIYEIERVDVILPAIANSRSITLFFEETGSVTAPVHNNLRSAIRKLERCTPN